MESLPISFPRPALRLLLLLCLLQWLLNIAHAQSAVAGVRIDSWGRNIANSIVKLPNSTIALVYIWNKHLSVRKYSFAGQELQEATYIVPHMYLASAPVLNCDNEIVIFCECHIDQLNLHQLVMVKLDLQLRKVSEKVVEGLKQYMPAVDAGMMYIAASNTYVFTVNYIRCHRPTVFEINDSGELVWENDVISYDSAWEVTLPPRLLGNDIVLAFTHGLITFNASRNRTDETNLGDFVVYDIVETAERELLLLGERSLTVGRKYKDMQIMKLGRDRSTILWCRDLSEETKFHITQFAHLGGSSRYFLFGDEESSMFASGRRGLIEELDQNGTMKWRLSLKTGYSVTALLELRDNEYLTVIDGDFSIEKYTVPPYVDHLKCEDLSDCKVCAMGYYWNYTRCVECPMGCAACPVDTICTSCLKGYESSPDNNYTCIRTKKKPVHNKTATCNCTSENPTRECAKNCSRPYVPAGKTADPVILVAPVCSSPAGTSNAVVQYLENRTGTMHRTCICQQQSKNPVVDNGTHCFFVGSEGCAGLCAACSKEEGRPIHCFQCRNLSRVARQRVGRLFFDCQCDSGCYFDGSKCDCTTNSQTKGSALITVGLVIVVVGLGIVAVAAAWRVYRRRRAKGERRVEDKQVPQPLELTDTSTGEARQIESMASAGPVPGLSSEARAVVQTISSGGSSKSAATDTTK